MKVYLSVPMIANRALERANLMAKAITESGHEVTSRWVLGPLERPSQSGTNIFHRDMAGAENSDIIVADVTVPSIGVGMELMAAYKAGRRIIIVSKKGGAISMMLQQMDSKETLEYGAVEEIYEGLRELLK